MNSQGVNQSQCKAGYLHVNQLWLYTRLLYVIHSASGFCPLRHPTAVGVR